MVSVVGLGQMLVMGATCLGGMVVAAVVCVCVCATSEI